MSEIVKHGLRVVNLEGSGEPTLKKSTRVYKDSQEV